MSLKLSPYSWHISPQEQVDCIYFFGLLDEEVCGDDVPEDKLDMRSLRR